MQRITVATQCADARTVICQNLLKFGKGSRIFEHRQFAVRISRIVAGTKLDGCDLECLEFRENCGQRELREQGRKHSNAHNVFLSPGPKSLKD
jgi:hypothetical protein